MARNIIILSNDSVRECWTSLVLLCENHPEFSYTYLKGLKFPFESKGWKFEKQELNKKADE